MAAEAVCIASGPSLTAEDCEMVRNWRRVSDDRMVIVTNLTFRAVPWADALYAMDRAWWRVYGSEAGSFAGKRYCRHRGIIGVEQVPIRALGSHSGADAIRLAAHLGARKIVLLGYDCQHTGGKRHWHDDYSSRGLGNASSVERWPKQLRRVRDEVSAEIVNASRQTALDIFPRVPLEAICGVELENHA